jgi:hypothetical protein
VCDAKPWVCFDWLMSLSKLQPCLELCHFIHALLKTKVARWKTYSLIGIGKRPMCIICQNILCITQDTQLERRALRLESPCYNKSNPGPKLRASLRPMIESLPCLFQALLDFSKHYQHVVHFQLSVLLGSHRSSSCIIVVS